MDFFLWLGIWWRHEFWKSENLNFYYLENKKSFWSEIKNIFPSFASTLFRLKNQTSKNVVNTTFKITFYLPSICLSMQKITLIDPVALKIQLI